MGRLLKCHHTGWRDVRLNEEIVNERSPAAKAIKREMRPGKGVRVFFTPGAQLVSARENPVAFGDQFPGKNIHSITMFEKSLAEGMKLICQGRQTALGPVSKKPGKVCRIIEHGPVKVVQGLIVKGVDQVLVPLWRNAAIGVNRA